MTGTRHAKNCTSLGHFTKYERIKMNHWGNKVKRLSKYNIKHWDACGLCLKIPINPMSCPYGDIFCKNCIYVSILFQKKKIKQLLMLFEKQKLQLVCKKEKKKKELKINKLIEFHKFEIGSIQNMSKKKERNLVCLKKEDYGSKITSDRWTVVQEFTKQEKTLNCFWLPNLNLNSKLKKLKLPDQNTYCPQCSKPLKINKLKVLHLSLKHNFSPKEPGRENYICPICFETLTYSQIKLHIRSCGHVICLKCLNRFSYKKKICPLCMKTFKKRDIVRLTPGGSGFCASGAQIFSAKEDISFKS